MTIEKLTQELEKLGVKRFCFRVRYSQYEAMVINKQGDVFGVTEDTVSEAAESLINALKTKKVLGGEGWKELLNPNLN